MHDIGQNEDIVLFNDELWRLVKFIDILHLIIFDFELRVISFSVFPANKSISHTLYLEHDGNDDFERVKEFQRQTGSKGSNLIIDHNSSYSINSIILVIDDIIDNYWDNYDIDPSSKTCLTYQRNNLVSFSIVVLIIEEESENNPKDSVDDH